MVSPEIREPAQAFKVKCVLVSHSQYVLVVSWTLYRIHRLTCLVPEAHLRARCSRAPLLTSTVTTVSSICF